MTEENEQSLINLRPIIPQAEVNAQTNSIEGFQNTTLRPIIKLLNNSILSSIKFNLNLFNKSFSELTQEKKIDNLCRFLEKNQKIRAYLQGMIVGFMTNNELDFYFSKSSEFNKRIMQMIEQRAVDHLDFFKQ